MKHKPLQNDDILLRDRSNESRAERPSEPEEADVRFHLRDVQYVQPRDGGREQVLHMKPALILIHDGEGKLEFGDQMMLVKRGDFIRCPAGSTTLLHFSPAIPVASTLDAGTTGSATVFHFDCYCFGGEEPHGKRQTENPCPWLPESGSFAARMERMGLLCRDIFKLFHSGNAQKVWLARIEFESLLQELIKSAALSTQDDRLSALEVTKSYIDFHYEEEHSLEKLAEMAELSPNYFAEQFKKYYTVSPMEYVAEVRLRKAKQLMAAGRGSLKEIAHAVGYRDEFYFSRRFKKSFGLSPSAYQRARHGKLAVYGSSAILGYLSALGSAPYAAPLHPKWSPYYYRTMGPEIPVHLNAYRHRRYQEDNLDQIRRIDPELILCSSELRQEELEALNRISPIYEIGHPAEPGEWQVQLRELSRLLRREEEAEKWLKDYESLLGDAKAALAQAVGTRKILLLRLMMDSFYVSGDEGAQEALFTQLGLTKSSFMTGVERGESLRCTIEEIQASDAEVLLLIVRQDSQTLKYWRAIQSESDWTNLPQVKQGDVHVMTSYPWREYSPAAIRNMIFELPSILGK